MMFPTDFCPVCGFKLKFDIADETSVTNTFAPALTTAKVTTHFCPINSFTVKVHGNYSPDYTTEVFHYVHREYPQGIVVEIIVLPYMLRHCPSINKTRLYYLPSEDEPMQLIAQMPLIKNLDYSKTTEVIAKLKTLTLFS